MKYRIRLLMPFTFILLLAACAAPRSLPSGPTPIPTLFPVVEPINFVLPEATPSFTILSYPARPPMSSLGQKLYQDNCAKCHGEDGKGVVAGARNFNDLDYMRGETPASFYAVITDGRGEMPSFLDSLSSDERWDVVFYMWRFSTTAETLSLGKNIYDTNCAACHGEDGVGKVLGAADFTDLRFVDDRAPRDFYLTLTQGKGSMPAWQGRLSQDERWAVIDYLRTFSYDPTLPEDVAVEPAEQPTATEVVCSSSYLSQSNQFDWDDSAAIAAGEKIYKQSCSVCHSTDGSGSLPGAPDFTAARLQEELRTTSGEFLCVMSEGRGAMPGWKKSLSDEQIWQVLTYIGTLGK